MSTSMQRDTSKRHTPPPSPHPPAKKIRVTKPANIPTLCEPSDDPSTQPHPKTRLISSHMPHIFLNHAQRSLIELAKNGHTIFFSGPAGSGKSVVLSRIIDTLHRHYEGVVNAVGVTSVTGITAIEIGGMTLHAWAGIGYGMGTAEELISRILKNRPALDRWRNSQVLVVDEVGMLHGSLFTKLDAIARRLRVPNRPFGGLQLVLAGDPLQLPPISRKPHPRVFFFESPVWKDSVPHCYTLEQVYRQLDPGFHQILQEVRFAELSPQTISKLSSLDRPPRTIAETDLTKLFALKQMVEDSNESRLRGLNGRSVTYTARDAGDPGKGRCHEDSIPALSRLELRVGARVMLIRKLATDLVNGSIGRVIGFDTDPAWSAAHFNQTLGAGGFWPVVRFFTRDDRGRPAEDPIDLIITPIAFNVEVKKNDILFSRLQVPLILAWAISIHKSQGQGLRGVELDVDGCWEDGQVYTGISRTKDLETLRLRNFSQHKIHADPKAVAFIKSLPSPP